MNDQKNIPFYRISPTMRHVLHELRTMPDDEHKAYTEEKIVDFLETLLGSGVPKQ